MAKRAFFIFFLTIVGVFVVRTWLLNRHGQSLPVVLMTRVIDEVHFSGTPLEGAFAELSHKSGVRIDVDWAELEKIGVIRTTPVSLRLVDQPAETVLRELLAQAQVIESGTPSFTRERDSITVTTRDAIDRHVELRMYDVGRTAERFGIPAEARLSKNSAEYRDRLVAVEALIGPPYSDEDFGGRSAMIEWRSRLFVRTCAETHCAIEQALRKLEGMEDSTPQLRPVVGPFPSLNADVHTGDVESYYEARKAKLDAKVDELVLENATLDQAIAVLHEKTRANIVIDWRDLEADGFQRKATARLRISDVPLGKALNLVLAAFGDWRKSLTPFVQNGIIHIAHPESMATQPTRVYDVADFMNRFLRLNDSNAANLTAAQARTASTMQRLGSIDVLIKMVEEQVDPNSWRDNGGTTGAVKEVAGLLVVTQTPENHHRVELLLKNLRKLHAAIDRGDKPEEKGIDLLKE